MGEPQRKEWTGKRGAKASAGLAMVEGEQTFQCTTRVVPDSKKAMKWREEGRLEMYRTLLAVEKRTETDSGKA